MVSHQDMLQIFTWTFFQNVTFQEKQFIKHMIFEKFQASLITRSSNLSNLKY